MVKSTWPGVSMMLTSVSFHLQYVAALWMVMPFSLSRSIESIFAPTPSLPRTCGSESCFQYLDKTMLQIFKSCLNYGLVFSSKTNFTSLRNTKQL